LSTRHKRSSMNWMDYHFVVARGQKKRRVWGGSGGYARFIKSFLPVFMVALFLPFFVALTLRPTDIRFFTKAEKDSETLRIWIEPSTVVCAPGSRVELRVMALFESEDVLIPGMKIGLVPEGAASVEPASVSIKKPFKGQVEVGRVKVTPLSLGNIKVTIPESMVEVISYSGKLSIVTGPANLIVK
jgi:hypothetical protein